MSDLPTYVLERVFDAPRGLVWKAWTDPDLLARWFAPGRMRAEVLALDVRAGGRYRIRMHDEDGETHTVGGRFVEVAPQVRLVMTWGWEGGETQESQVTVNFAPRDTGTEVRILHEGLPDKASVEAHGQGWHGCLENLVQRIGSF